MSRTDGLAPGISPEEALGVLKRVAEASDSDLTTILSRDAEGKLVSVAVYATGGDAMALMRYLKRREALAKAHESLAQGRGRPAPAGGKH